MNWLFSDVWTIFRQFHDQPNDKGSSVNVLKTFLWLTFLSCDWKNIYDNDRSIQLFGHLFENHFTKIILGHKV